MLATCSLRNVPIGQESVFSLPDLHFQPAKSATVGQFGTVTITVTVPGMAPAVRTSTITISEPVDLAAGEPTSLEAIPGTTAEVPFVVHNVGRTAVNGTELTFQTGAGLVPGKRYSNCRYTPFMTRCRFDGVLDPGAAYVLAEQPLTVPADVQAPTASGVFYWWDTVGDADEAAYYERFFAEQPVAGTAAPLRLVRADQPQRLMRATGQTDVDYSDNVGQVDVDITADNRPDPAAVGASVNGTVGAAVKVNVGVKNLGPAQMEHRVSLGNLAPWTADVTVPAGTTAVEVPGPCDPIDPDGKAASREAGKLGAERYRCTWVEGLGVGAERLFPFTLRIDQAGTHEGEVTFVLPDRTLGKVRDRNEANNTAKIVVNATLAGGTGGSLPITGANTGLLAGAGIVLVTLGGASVVIARRRRGTFVA